jgi:DNA-binding MarR family transcriptional regulator
MSYLESTIGYSIRRAQLAVFQHIYETFGDRSLTLADFSVLAVAADNPGISQSELAKALAVERPRIVPILNKLESMGLAKRVVGDEDKRSRRISLSDKGLRKLSQLKRSFRRHEEHLDAILGTKMKALLELLHQVSKLPSSKATRHVKDQPLLDTLRL